MNRRTFLKYSAILPLSALGTEFLPGIFDQSQGVVLPTIDGDIKVFPIAERFSLITSSYARDGYYSDGYMQMAPYQQLLAQQQAISTWQHQLMQLRMQKFQWILQQQINALRQQMQQLDEDYQIGNPDPWDSIKSIYGLAVNKNDNNKVALIGVNENSSRVRIEKTVQGAGSVFEKIGEYFGRETQEKAVGPQSNEFAANIILPNGNSLLGKGYETKYGAFGISNDVVRTEDGKVGQLAKYKLGKDGNQYLIV